MKFYNALREIKVRTLCTLPELFDGTAPIQLELISEFGNSLTGEELNLDALDWLADHPEDASQYELQGLVSYYGKLVGFLNMTEEASERYAFMSEYEAYLKTYYDPSDREIPELKEWFSKLDALQAKGEMFTLTSGEWYEFNRLLNEYL